MAPPAQKVGREWMVDREARFIGVLAQPKIAEQRTRQILSVNEKIARMRESREFITVTTWLDRYLAIQQERLDAGGIKLNSVKQKTSRWNYCASTQE